MNATGAVPGIRISLGDSGDDAELRRLLRENPVPGPVTLTYEREPDFFLASRIEGDRNQTLVARDQPSGRIAGLGSRSVYTAYVNGVPCPIGYLSQLRVDRPHRGNARLVLRGYEKLRELHEEDGGVRFYLTSLIDGNLPAHRLLTSGHPRLPCYRPLECLRTLVLDAWAISPAEGTTARSEEGAEIVACLQRNAPRYQFCRSWTTSDLFSPERSNGLSVVDFQAVRAQDRVTGCMALWDQSCFKQVVVQGYSPLLRFFRPALNVWETLRHGDPALPPAGQPLRMAYLSHVAVDGDDSDVLLALLRGAAARARKNNIRHVVLGLSARNRMLEAVRKAYSPMEYGSTLYAVFWKDGEEAVRSLDSRPCHTEVARL